MSITIKSLSIDVTVFHVGCPKASDESHHPTMIFSGNCFSGKLFRCTACGAETSIKFKVNEDAF